MANDSKATFDPRFDAAGQLLMRNLFQLLSFSSAGSAKGEHKETESPPPRERRRQVVMLQGRSCWLVGFHTHPRLRGGSRRFLTGSVTSFWNPLDMAL